MSNGKASLAKDPYYQSMKEMDQDLSFGNPFGDREFTYKSKIFSLSKTDYNNHNKKYEDLMNKLYDPSETNVMLIPDRTISKSWSKEGDLLIHVEYLEFSEAEAHEDEDAFADNQEF